ncbi:MAG: 4Fe-4S binding protein [Nitrospirae bacterium]|nr:4Fe-4S binding protein [Nitrospirota bacterium]
MYIVVNRDKCTACGECINTCPYDSIVMKDGKAFITEFCQLCGMCMSACPEGAISEKKEAGDEVAAKDLTAYSGVLVFAEQRDGELASVAFELLGVGRKLADDLGEGLSAILLGADASAAKELIEWGADKVYHCNDAAFNKFNDEPYSIILSKHIDKYKPAVVLAGATPIGRSFLPRVAARLRTGLTADCTSLEIDKETKNLLQVRPAFGGNIMATILTPNHRPQMATVRPRVMKRGEHVPGRAGEVINIDHGNIPSRTKVINSVKEESGLSVNIHEAEIIVAGGRGVGKEGFKMLEELAEALDGVVGASRAPVDEGWISYSHQVGQTGKTVCPKIYIACGISGAVQHLVGMQSSDIIIAINKNHDAPIFNVATYGIVGDLFEVVPMLTKKIKEVKGI